MKALVLESVGNLVYKDVPDPVARSGEVLLRIRACGICSSDFDRCLKTGTYHFPTIPGHEFAGEIVSVGDGVDKKYLRRRAAVFPLLPDMTCDQCLQQAYARCRNYNYFGSRCDGAFAELIAVPVWNLQLFSDSMPYKVGALCEPAAVSYHAVSTADIGKSDSVCIVGTGTIGILSGLMARMRGGNVAFASRSEKKNTFLKELGFSWFVAPGENLTNGAFGKVLECVGSDASIARALELAAPAGQVVLVGNPDGDKHLPRKAYWKVLRSELTLKGIWNSNYAAQSNEWSKVLRIFEAHPDVFAKLITHEFSLKEGVSAFLKLRESKTLVLKGMFIND